MRNEYSPQLSKLLYNCELKNKELTNTLKGSRRMGGGRIFLKSLPDTYFNKDLLNEPNFGLDHLTREYL
jgi:hypothetical protein